MYQRIQAVLQRLPEIHISLSAIVAVGEHKPVVRHLRQSMPLSAGDVDVTITLPNYAPYSPYLTDNEGSVRVYVYRLVPSGNTAAKTSA